MTTPVKLNDALREAERIAGSMDREPAFHVKAFVEDLEIIRESVAFSDDPRERRIAELALKRLRLPLMLASLLPSRMSTSSKVAAEISLAIRASLPMFTPLSLSFFLS